MIRSDIEYSKTIIKNETNKLTDIKKNFEMKIQDKNHAKFLKKTFKKKLKIPKVYSNDVDGNVVAYSFFTRYTFDTHF